MGIKISAILPNFNSAAFLPHAIQSLVEQRESFFEIIIIDDGSHDESLTIIKKYMAEHKHIYLIQHDKNLGVCASLNDGIKAATGDYIILCAADDWYHQDIVAKAKQAIKTFPDVGLVCGDAIVQRYDQNSSFRRTLPYVKKNTWITANEFKLLAQKSYVGFNGGGGMFINRNAILNAGLLYPQLRWHCDWMLYFVIAFQQGIYYIDEPFVYINMRKEGYSEGKRMWKIQKQVIIETIELLQQRYADLWDIFKETSLLPHYSVWYIPLFLSKPKLRRFFTFSLLWKCLVNNIIVVRIGRLFPYRVILGMRKFLRA